MACIHAPYEIPLPSYRPVRHAGGIQASPSPSAPLCAFPSPPRMRYVTGMARDVYLLGEIAARGRRCSKSAGGDATDTGAWRTARLPSEQLGAFRRSCTGSILIMHTGD